jgi:tetratricopeptide (TPR) repeat protein
VVPPRADETPARRYSAGDALDERYTIIEEIGVGGMGIVYKALDRQLGKPIALKLMRPKAMDPSNIARFRRELSLARHVSHPNVCRVHDLGEVDGVLYISMEYVEGQRLDHLIVAMGHLSPRQTIALGRQICAGLRAIHEQGIVHRDLKPSNIMVNRSGHVFIMDFGLAVRPGAEKVTSTGAVLGTFAYLSPEQARGHDIGPRSDVYAVGLVLFEMLTGVTPPGDDVALPLALRDASDRCPFPGDMAADVPPALDDLVMRCLERDPARRFGSAEELEQALATLQTALGTQSSRTHARRVSGRFPLRRVGPKARWTAAAGIAATAFALVLSLWPKPAPVPAPADATPVLAVLPFTNLSGDPTFDAAALAATDILLTRLATLPGLVVVAASPPRDLPPGGNRIKSVATESGATLILEGTLYREQSRVRATVKLLKTSGAVLWPGEFECPADRPMELPSRIAEALSSALEVNLSPAQRETLGRPPTRDALAFAEYGEALRLLQSPDARDPERAERLLSSATRRDPQFSLAFAALGQAYWSRYQLTKDVAMMRRATDAVLQALRLDPEQPGVRLSLALNYYSTGRTDEALDEVRQALAQQPTNDDCHRLLGDILAENGRFDEALLSYNTAVRIRPRYWKNHRQLALAYYRMGRLDDAATAARRVIEHQPRSVAAHQLLGTIYQVMPRDDLALESYAEANRLEPAAPTYINIGRIEHERGRHEQAAEAYGRALALDPKRVVLHRNLGDLNTDMGRPEAARASYTEALRLADAELTVNARNPRALSVGAICLAKLGRFEAARQRSVEALAVNRADKELLYRHAAVLALSGRREAAVAALAEAFRQGYSPKLALRDPDVKPLLSSPALSGFFDGSTPPRGDR